MADSDSIQVAPQDPCASQTPPELRNLRISLEPLRTEGRDSLSADAADDFLQVNLSQVTTASPTSFRHTTTITADDIFEYVGADGKHKNPIPLGETLMRAILTFLFRDSVIPHTVELSPPGTIAYEHPADARRILPFLARHKFITPQKIATLLFIILALTSAALPDLDDDDDDDDYSDDHPHHYAHIPT